MEFQDENLLWASDSTDSGDETKYTSIKDMVEKYSKSKYGEDSRYGSSDDSSDDSCGSCDDVKFTDAEAAATENATSDSTQVMNESVELTENAESIAASTQENEKSPNHILI